MRNHPALIPELKVQSFTKSLDFYQHLAGFTISYSRPEDEFAMLEREGAFIMIESLSPTSRAWITGEMEPPFGRGINFQIEVSAVDKLHKAFTDAQHPIYLPLEETWYRKDTTEVGNAQFIVQDPDGYLLRFFEDIGERPAS